MGNNNKKRQKKTQNPHNKLSHNKGMTLWGPRAKRNKARTAIRGKSARSGKVKNTCNKKARKTILQNGQKKSPMRGKKTQPTMSAPKYNISLTQRQTKTKHRHQKRRTQQNQHGEKDSIKKKQQNSNNDFALKNYIQSKSNAGKTAKPCHSIYQAKANKTTAAKQGQCRANAHYL